MNPTLFFSICLLFAELFAASIASAQIFGRRNCNTGHCFTPHVAAAKERDVLQTIIINNAAPGSLDTPRGTTGYGSLVNALDVRLASDLDYLNDSRLHITASESSTAAARAVAPGLHAIAQRNADANNTLAKGEAAAQVIRSFGGESSGSTRSVMLTLRNGKVEEFKELTPTPAEVPGPAATPRAFAGQSLCLKCHAVGGSAEKHFVIDDTFNEDKMLLAKEQIDAGTMPPKSALTEAEKLRELLKLGRLVPVQ